MTRAALDWSGHRVGPPRPCRLCGKPALLRDALDRPCHKVCVESAVDRMKGRTAA